MSLERQARAVATSYGTIVNGTRYTSMGGYWESGQFWRLREVSATIQMPARLAAGMRARATRTSRSAAAISTPGEIPGRRP
jgi:hypothetical protein